VAAISSERSVIAFRFALGRIVATRGGREALRRTEENPFFYVERHVTLDPGSLGAEDEMQNLRAVREGARIFSSYELTDGTRIWVITEADRSATTILLPDEY
jgi:hypothetical protein